MTPEEIKAKEKVYQEHRSSIRHQWWEDNTGQKIPDVIEEELQRCAEAFSSKLQEDGYFLANGLGKEGSREYHLAFTYWYAGWAANREVEGTIKCTKGEIN